MRATPFNRQILIVSLILCWLGQASSLFAQDGSFAGIIATEEDETVAGVLVVLTNPEAQISITTNADGQYVFPGSPVTAVPLTITPTRDDNWQNGVSTFDRILITKHILGIQLLDSPYKLIAADVNNNGQISVLDLIALQQIILDPSSASINNTSWRFIPASYDFLDPTDPWQEPIPVHQVILSLEPSIIDVDFVAIKIGDVNGSAVAN
ncbi:MAG: hypothetical protein KDC54_00345 [Lewinella sp.]|nr:hypothetical protein [Lewinella sp.]